MKNLKSLGHSVILCSAFAGTVAQTACSHTPPAELVSARQVYERASTGQAARLKPEELHKAQTALQAAERNFSDEHDTPKTRDLAYVAQRKAELAEALAAGVEAEQQQDAARKAYEDKQAALLKQQQQQLGQTKEQLGAVKQSAAEAEQQLAQEQKAREAAEQQAAQAREALSALAAKEEARGTVITLSGSVLFRSNESTLLPEAQSRLNQVADALLQTKDRNVVVEGHTDSRGSASLNQSLSQRRAEAVRAYLVSRGYPTERITAQGIAAERPIADNKTAEGRANNRRVEIIVAPKAGA